MTCSKNQELIRTTINTIQSLKDSEQEIKFEITLIESGHYFDYGVNQIEYPNIGNFNYNYACNIGLNHTKNKFVLLCNNDILFEIGFADKLMKGFEQGYQSLSPKCLYNDKTMIIPKDLEGYYIGQHIHGCCIAIDRDILKIIGKLDETCAFWFADHIYAEQLKRYGIKHKLIPDAVITHLEAQTLNTLTADEYYDLTFFQKQYFDNYPKVDL